VPLSLKLIKYVDKLDVSTWLDRRKGKAGEDDNGNG